MPVLHLLAGPNGSGKSTYVDRLLGPVTRLPFVNADVIAAERWPDAQAAHAYDASRAAAEERSRLLEKGTSFITETVFSHPSKLELLDAALSRGYLVHLHVMLVPVEVSVRRVAERVRAGGHDVPEQKIRDRHARLWHLVARARSSADRTEFFDNGSARSPFRLVATYEHGLPLGEPDWPSWAPTALRADAG
ncbi:AAA family ATPase [Leifsonia sp. NPDC058194]|uniref:AAA family ATPase n=1 Tax=Leifsonia sp. NPDC058194 TaxID=3346374 RepID=UPI0036DF3409